MYLWASVMFMYVRAWTRFFFFLQRRDFPVRACAWLVHLWDCFLPVCMCVCVLSGGSKHCTWGCIHVFTMNSILAWQKVPGLCSHPFSACLALSHSHFAPLLFLHVSHPLAHSLYLFCLSPSNRPPPRTTLVPLRWSSGWFAHLWCTRIKCCNPKLVLPDWLLGVTGLSQAMKGNLFSPATPRAPPATHQFKVPFSNATTPPLLLWPAAQTVVKLAHSQLRVWMLKLDSWVGLFPEVEVKNKDSSHLDLSLRNIFYF